MKTAQRNQPACQENTRAVRQWCLADDRALFREHFPGAPRVPGSLLIEALRTEAAACFPEWRVTGLERFQFRQFVEPGTCVCTLELQPELQPILQLEGQPVSGHEKAHPAPNPGQNRPDVSEQDVSEQIISPVCDNRNRPDNQNRTGDQTPPDAKAPTPTRIRCTLSSPEGRCLVRGTLLAEPATSAQPAQAAHSAQTADRPAEADNRTARLTDTQP